MADQDKKTEEVHNFKFYARHDNFAKIIGNRKLFFGIWGLCAYIGHFILIIATINSYSDQERFISCGIDGVDRRDFDYNTRVYDAALALVASYHIIEWVRVILFLTTMLLGQNFIPIYYATALNTLYGLAVYIYIHVCRYSGDGKACEDAQKYRATMLMVEVIVFWVTFHIGSYPHIYLHLASKENLEDALKDQEEDGEGSDKE